MGSGCGILDTEEASFTSGSQYFGLPFVRIYFKFKARSPEFWSKMKRHDFHEEIKELNLAYLMLAQQMLRDDRETAMLRLGIGDEAADLLEGLSGARLVRMASNQMVMPRLHFEDANLLGLMAGDGRDPVSATLHAAILAANRSREE